MSEMLELSRILVVRNDSVAEWESSEYILEKGEFGVGFWERNGQLLPIVKLGDGVNIWVDLPQTEHVLTEDLVISDTFGRHKAVNGYVNAGGTGMTITEWIKDALCYEVTDAEGVKIYPSAEIVEIDFKTNTGTTEAGSKLTEIFWKTKVDDGKYIFGSKLADGTITTDTTIQTNLGFSATYISEDGTESTLLQAGTTEGSGDISHLGIVLEEGKTEYGKVVGTLSWTDATNVPLSSYKKPLPEHRIVGADTSCEKHLTIQAKNALGFYGTSENELLEANITSKLIYELKGHISGESTEKVHILEVAPGTKTVVIACKEGYDITRIYNETAGAEMLNSFKLKESVQVTPIAGITGANYSVYYYTPIIPY